MSIIDTKTATTTTTATETVTVRVAKLGQSVREVTVPRGASVATVLRDAGVPVGREDEIRLDGNVVKTDAVINDATVITLVPQITGGKY